MPKVLTKGGFAFVIYFKDHEPAHVHVFAGRAGKGPSMTILLESQQAIPEQIPSSWTDAQARRALIIAVEHHDTFLETWSRNNR